MIYLVGSNLKYRGVKSIVLNEISYFKFDLDLSDFDALVVTSKNSISALKFNKISAVKDIAVFSIGSSTSNLALSYGFCNVYTAKNSHGDDFADEIITFLKDKKVLFLRAKTTVSNVYKKLTEANIQIKQVIAYENKFKQNNEPKPSKDSVIIFTSPSAVNNFITNYGWDDSYRVVAIGQTTARELKFTKDLKISQIQTIDECIRLAKTFF